MRLIVDANILVRCVIGKALKYVDGIVVRGITPVICERQIEESFGVIVGKFKANRSWAENRLSSILRPFDVISVDSYELFGDEAKRRLRYGAGDDWHCLAASILLSAPIWSEDIDFFGSGAAVWSTANLKFIPAQSRTTDAR